MSVSSYRLETPRPRPPPLPIRTSVLSRKQTSPFDSNDASDTLLRDLPSSTTGSPVRAYSPSGPTTPISPRSRTRASRMTPPPSRSMTPSQPARSDLEQFAELCRAWYFDQNDNSGRLMTQTLATLPPSQRAPYARLQASIRAAYHASVNARRDAEFRAHLAAINPGGSLMPHSRADPGGPLARKERFERFERFVKTWCTTGMPGTKPFFQGLWAVMRLQIVPEHLGGAGGYRIEWEIDDAVFKEAAGKDFMLEAIDVLKGVLGFEEAPSRRPSSASNSPAPYAGFAPLSPIHSRSQSQPLPSDISAPGRSQKVPPITSRTQTKRPRAPSDPFLDTPTLSTSYSSANTSAQFSTSGSSSADEPGTPPTPADGENLSIPKRPAFNLSENEGYMRIWTAPDLPNQEYLTLLTIFPPFLSQSTLPRFAANSGNRPADIEEGANVPNGTQEIRVGTGTMWLGPKLRSAGWQGSWWIRFKSWLRRIFC
ncbi:hypothetical protein CERSUDRAFT_114012 [Gelatoporia subvermispora B]|uniref:Uncharacterized protein n=1 Tax=Ceriporiopsis subvermispora (strain B) TaxID=914234 RepID=M2PLS5_CERS8|nr:hypothetical protein CERSUDRAFT_114012 [Gelatoporia subvermispora B]